MIFRSNDGYLADETLDQGDSAVRIGILSAFGNDKEDLKHYEIMPGKLVRSPTQFPWNNPNNFTRDQLLPILAGLHVHEETNIAKRVFYSHMRRLFFCQNGERDFPGSTKYPWPHEFINDKQILEKRLFDFRDFLMPSHIGALIIAGRIQWAYVFLPFCYLIHFLLMLGHTFSDHNEENQMLSECLIYGTLKFYTKLNPQWRSNSLGYWAVRHEIEYHQVIESYIDQL